MAFLMLKKDVKRMKGNKNLEYYLDSRIYSTEEVRKSIEETKKEFPNKKVEVKIALNDFGMYIITFQFENKNTFWNRVVVRIWAKFKKTLMLGSGNKTEKPQEKPCYGQYKPTKTYKPY